MVNVSTGDRGKFRKKESRVWDYISRSNSNAKKASTATMAKFTNRDNLAVPINPHRKLGGTVVQVFHMDKCFLLFTHSHSVIHFLDSVWPVRIIASYTSSSVLRSVMKFLIQSQYKYIVYVVCESPCEKEGKEDDSRTFRSIWIAIILKGMQIKSISFSLAVHCNDMSTCRKKRNLKWSSVSWKFMKIHSHFLCGLE